MKTCLLILLPDKCTEIKFWLDLIASIKSCILSSSSKNDKSKCNIYMLFDIKLFNLGIISEINFNLYAYGVYLTILLPYFGLYFFI